MKVTMNDNTAFGYTATGIIKGHAFDKAPHLRSEIRSRLINSDLNPYGENTNINMIIHALDLHNFWDKLRFKQPPHAYPARYQLLVEIRKANETLPQKLKRLFNPEHKVVVAGNDNSLVAAANELTTNLEQISTKEPTSKWLYVGDDRFSFSTIG